MIELLLQAERALSMGMLDQAEKLYWQTIEADPRSSIAVVGLARVALERDDEGTAYRFGLKALELDPENAAAQRLVSRLDEVMRYRGEAPPPPSSGLSAGTPSASAHASAHASASAPAPTSAPRSASAPAPKSSPASSAQPPKPSPTAQGKQRNRPIRQTGLLARLFGRRHR